MGLKFLSSDASAIYCVLALFNSACIAAAFALLTMLENVGIRIAAKIAITAITITSSTIVKPFYSLNLI